PRGGARRRTAPGGVRPGGRPDPGPGRRPPPPAHPAAAHPRAGRRPPRGDDTDMTTSDTAAEPTRAPVIGILFFDGVEELDAAGPWEVLSFWAEHVAGGAPRTVAISPDGRPVRCAKGLRVSADHSRDGAPGLDVLIHPGGRG